jgi:DNA-binding response OmpR family regulator
MNPQLVLLYTRDEKFGATLAEALIGKGATILTAQNVTDALKLVCRHARNLDLAVLDFSEGCRGMTLLSAIHTCAQRLPVLVTTSTDVEHTKPIAYANGARACLNKPLGAAALGIAIAEVIVPNYLGVAA